MKRFSVVHWLAIVMFVAGLLSASTRPDMTWGQFFHVLTPFNVFGYVVAVCGFLTTMFTDKPRGDQNSRSTDLPNEPKE